jgi:RimJ/RimL family protein N-acetyltransferase
MPSTTPAPTPPNVVVRTATERDAEALVQLRRALFAETSFLLWEAGEYTLAAEDERQRLVQDAQQANNCTLLALADGHAVGFLAVMGGARQRNRHNGLLAMGVRQSHWGQGIGQLLLQQALAWAPSAGLSRLELHVHAHNQRAVALYRRCGFAVEGLRRGAARVDGRDVDEYLMARRLDEAAPSALAPGTNPARQAVRRDAYIARLADDLMRRHGAHTVLLYGSHADGSATPTSDYDLAAFAPVPRKLWDARVVDGRYLDAFIHPDSVLDAPGEDHLQLRGSLVLAQRGDQATQFLARLDALFSAGPARKPDDELQGTRVWCWKMLDRLARGDLEGHYRRHWLLMALLEDYFLLRGQWYLGPKKSLRLLQQADPAAYTAFEAALKPDADAAALRTMVQQVAGDAPVQNS